MIFGQLCVAYPLSLQNDHDNASQIDFPKSHKLFKKMCTQIQVDKKCFLKPPKINNFHNKIT